MNVIEAGASWPEDLLHARATYMKKDDADPLNPVGFRVLLMLPVVYRRWVAVRLAHLEPWIQKWALSGIYAGISGRSAADAAYKTAIELERAKLEDQAFSGGVADIWKCFDQVDRRLLYHLMQKGGVPKGMLNA